MTVSKPKVLYAASTKQHLDRFHMSYIKELRKSTDLYLMATGQDVDFSVSFDKHFFSFQNLKSILQIRGILKKEKFDAVILHTTLAAFLIRAAMFGMKKRPRVLNVVHGYLFSKPIRSKKDRVLLLCEKIMRSKTDAIAVMNAEDLLIAQENDLCRGAVYSIRGMGVDGFPCIPQKNTDLRASLKIDSSRLVCTFVGELSRRKNQLFLIQAAKRLRDEGIPICLLLVGEGTEREVLENEIHKLQLEDVVRLLGSRNDVPDILSVTDIYVSASVSEGLPFNIMEAMYCGLPIVASNTKGQNDLLSAHPNALYLPDEMDSFCECLKAVLKTGKYGVGSVSYPEQELYRLSAVFQENCALFTDFIKETL